MTTTATTTTSHNHHSAVRAAPRAVAGAGASASTNSPHSSTAACNLRAITLHVIQRLLTPHTPAPCAHSLAKSLSQQHGGGGGGGGDDGDDGDDDARARRNARRRIYDALQVLRALGLICTSPRLRWTGDDGVANGVDGRVLMSRLVARARVQLTAKRETHARVLALCGAMQRQRGAAAHGEQNDVLRRPFVVVRVRATAEMRAEATRDGRTLLLQLSEPFQLINDAGVVVRLARGAGGEQKRDERVLRTATCEDSSADDLNSRPQDCLTDYETCALPTELM